MDHVRDARLTMTALAVLHVAITMSAPIQNAVKTVIVPAPNFVMQTTPARLDAELMPIVRCPVMPVSITPAPILSAVLIQTVLQTNIASKIRPVRLDAEPMPIVRCHVMLV